MLRGTRHRSLKKGDEGDQEQHHYGLTNAVWPKQTSTQWMTAGRGIIHSELPQDDFLQQGGVSHGFQIWVNLPAKDKMMQPRYQDIPAKDIPKVTSEDGKVWANVIAGSTLGVQAVIDTVIPITYIHMKIQQDGVHQQSIESGLNGMIYVFGGEVVIDNGLRMKTQPISHGLGTKQQIQDGELGILSEGEEIIIRSTSASEFLILAGPELNEPIERYGPFVMNTREEIRQAFLDYQNGTFVD